MNTRLCLSIVRFLSVLCLTLSPAGFVQSALAQTHCELCSAAFGDRYYSAMDKVLGERRAICGQCVQQPLRCFACGLPAGKEVKALSDGRHYCARDAATGLFTAAAIQTVIAEAEDQLRRLFVRDLSFPDGTLGVTLVDRVNIETLFARPGNDHHCPNVLGYYQAKTNGTRRLHEIYLLNGLTAGRTKSVFAHELTHAWIAENLPADRHLADDAEEGFCELIAYLLFKDLRDQAGMREIAANTYTRGQFEIFRRAHETYQLPTVIDWLKFGREPQIPADDIDVVRRAQPPVAAPPRLWVASRRPKPSSQPPADKPEGTAADTLRLKAVMGSASRRTALINDRSFETGEAGPVTVGGTPRQIRCLEIGPDFVRIERMNDGTQVTLRFEN